MPERDISNFGPFQIIVYLETIDYALVQNMPSDMYDYSASLVLLKSQRIWNEKAS